MMDDGYISELVKKFKESISQEESEFGADGGRWRLVGGGGSEVGGSESEALRRHLFGDLFETVQHVDVLQARA